jgi:hypothetical protein
MLFANLLQSHGTCFGIPKKVRLIMDFIQDIQFRGDASDLTHASNVAPLLIY